MEIYRDWIQRALPLVGPTVLSGEHIGPAFYYIAAPAFIFSGFNPLAPAIWTALIGIGSVAVLWWVGRELWGWRIATMVSLLWAVSPQIVSSDRALWEPNLVPFFALCFVLGIYMIWKRASFLWGAVMGAAVGILIQLHYPAFLFLALTLLFFLEVLREKKKLSPDLLAPAGGALVGFVVVVLPFTIYESMHGFADISAVLGGFFGGGGAPIAKRQILINFLDYSSRMVRRVIPFPGGWEVVSLLLLIASPFMKRSFWTVFFVFWFLAGTTAMALYHGVVFDHYLFFVLPVPFLIMGYFLSLIEKKTIIWVPLLITALIVFVQLAKTDIVRPGPKDLERVTRASQTILTESAGQPFAFGLIASRSFLDFHYRYFFLLASVEAQPVLSNTYKNLFLVCEDGTCATADQLLRAGSAQLICYDAHCSGTYPSVYFKEWKFLLSTDVSGARIYLFERI